MAKKNVLNKEYILIVKKMSFEYMEYLMRLQSRVCIAYLIHLNRRGAISNANLQEGIRVFSKVMQQASPSPPSASPKLPMPAPTASSRKAH